MSTMATKKNQTTTVYCVTQKDLPLCCPTPEMAIWNMHPRVYLKIEETGTATCPYCSTKYILQQKK